MNNLFFIQEKCRDKIKENINSDGILIASTSSNPDYKYYWIRDAALVFRCLIDSPILNSSLLKQYIHNEKKLQGLKTLSGLGEPKYNVDMTSFNGDWGRPQNDGPALRGLNMIRLYNYYITLNDLENEIIKDILDVLYNDIHYTLTNYDSPCFDLWEEINGWHFYTRVVQIKFIKESMKFIKEHKLKFCYQKLKKVYLELLKKLRHHTENNYIISSFDTNGNIKRINDSSIVMALCHVNFDSDILSIAKIDKIYRNITDIVLDFSKKYSKETYGMVGRYKNDMYFGGHIWIICSLCLVQFYIYYYMKYSNPHCLQKAKRIINFVSKIDSNMDIAEQYDIEHSRQVSAERLSWNYSELYFCCKSFKNIL